MSALSIQPTFPTFTDIDGQPLEAGYIFIGTANLNPITNPINVFFDAALTQPAVQPIRTISGYPSNAGTPARLYVNSDYSIQVQNKNGTFVYSAPTATERYSDVVVTANAEDVIYDPPFTNAVQTNVEAKLAQTVSVKDFGAVGDGVTDDTAAIQNAINSGAAEIVYPDGNYVASNLVMASNQRHVGMGGTITSLNNGNNIFNGVSVSNVDIVGLNFVGTEVALYAVFLQGTLSPASNSSNILIENCTASGGIQLFASYQPNGSTYSTITDAMLTDYVRVIGNKIVGTSGSKTGGGLGGIAFYYAKNCVATGNILETLQHGITWWGGDAAPGADGIQNNARKAYNITITGNTVVDVGGGGIWGSMGNWVTVTGNTVNDCDDVGIDFEGCFNSNATGNTVNDCNNGCLVTYHFLRNVSFVGNVCQQTVGGRDIAIQNTFSPLQQDSYDVSFIGNTFVCAQFNDICYVVGGYVQTFVFNENKCSNVVVKDLFDGPRAATYNNNVFVFKDTIGAAFNVIESTFAHGGTTIKGNTFITEALQPSLSTCIYVGSYQFSATVECHNISDNVTLRLDNTNIFDWDIRVEDTGGTNTVRFAINNNQLASTNKYGVFGTFVEAHLNGNVDESSNPYPLYVPPSTSPSGTWSAGQIAYPASPVAGGFVGMICTAAGTPGTWKTFGAISL